MKRIIVFVLILLFSLITYNSQGQDSTKKYPIIFIGKLNFDCLVDTVIAKQTDGGSFIPYYIIWAIADSNNCTGHEFDSLEKKITYFKYPDWVYNGTYSFNYFNGDTISDLFISIKGTITDSISVRDTSKVLVIFGQNQIDTTSEIDISIITADQNIPFTAREINSNVLVQASHRDYSEKISYIFNKFIVNVDPSDPNNQNPNYIPDDVIFNIRIYPNPSNEILNVEFKEPEVGNYSFSISSIIGLNIIKEEISITRKHDIIKTLDIANYPTGLYYFTVSFNNNIIFRQPIIIIH